jgi:FkbM family methyltransferase
MLLGKVGSLIDIGANDGVTCSNSYKFILNGARALLFEPVPSSFSILRLIHSRNRRVTAVNEGCSDRTGSVDIVSAGLLSFPLETEDKEHTKSNLAHFQGERVVIPVKVRPLSGYLSGRQEFRSCDFVSLDVEGHELAVLRGIDFRKFRTRCFIIETHGVGQEVNWIHRNIIEIRDILMDNGYKPVLCSPENSFWIHKDTYVAPNDFEKVCQFPGYVACSPEDYFKAETNRKLPQGTNERTRT